MLKVGKEYCLRKNREKQLNCQVEPSLPVRIVCHVLPVNSSMENIKQFGGETNVTIHINANRITKGRSVNRCLDKEHMLHIGWPHG